LQRGWHGEHKVLSTSGGLTITPASPQTESGSFSLRSAMDSARRTFTGPPRRQRPGAAYDSPFLDDEASLSPDGSQLAFVSTREGWRANVWILDLKTKKLTNLTGAKEIQGDPMKPDGFYRPQWSPDGKWIAFTSDRNTDWKGTTTIPAGSTCRSFRSISSIRTEAASSESPAWG